MLINQSRNLPFNLHPRICRWPWLKILCCLWGLSLASFALADGVYRVRDHGAKGDGQNADTAAINQAVEACAASGGGQVVFGPGKYLCGTIRLRSHIWLVLEAGATLIGTTNLNDYQTFSPPAGTPEARFRSNWHRALILGDDIENAGIVGPGVIDGHKVFDPQGEERMRGPHTVILGNSRNLVFRDVTVRDSANYAFLLEFCQQVEFQNLRITGGWDGIHFRGWPGRSCRNVTITACQIYTGDDAIAGRYWENVVISGCIINSACNGIRLIGPATHLMVHDCLFYGPGLHPHRTSNRFNMLAAINLQPGAWDATQGNLDDVLLSRLTIHQVATPFHFNLKPGNTAGNIEVNQVAATGIYRAAASVESWAESPFTNVVFRDISMEFTGGGTLEQAKMIVRQPGVDARPLPAWAFYARNVAKLTMDHIRLSVLTNDMRPVFIGERIDELRLRAVDYPQPPNASRPFRLRQTARIVGDPVDPAAIERQGDQLDSSSP